MFHFILLPQPATPALFPTTLRSLKTLVRDLKAQAGVHVVDALIVVGGKVSLPALAALKPPRTNLAFWVQARIEQAVPGFFETCVDKQAATAEARRQARKCGNQTRTPAPLAGVLLGGKERYPELHAAFYDAVKAGVLARHQAAALASGLAFAGVKSGDRVSVSVQDFMDPFTVVTQQGGDVDLRAEGVLARLARSRMELGRVQDGEEVRSRGDEGLEEAKQFAHSEFQLLSEDLLAEVRQQEGLVIPWDASARDARALAESIQDPYLQTRVMEALDRTDQIDDRERVYLHPGGQTAFRVRKTLPAAPWKPYEPTPDRAEDDVQIDTSDSPLAGWSAFDAGSTQEDQASVLTSRRVVSQATYDAMHAQLAHLLARKDEIAALMGHALEDGDLRESAAYDEARSMMFENQDAILKAELALLDVTVGDVAATNVGRTLTIKIDGHQRDVKLTDHQPMIGEISIASELGRSLLNAEAGQTFTVDSPVKSTRAMRVRMPVPDGTFTAPRHVPHGIRKPAVPDTLTVYRQDHQDIRWTSTKTVTHRVEVLALT